MSELIKIAARLARREGLPDDTPASVFNWLGAESIAIRTEADKQRALIETLTAALVEIVGCFDAADIEGFQERINEVSFCHVGSWSDIVIRRILPAADVARAAAKEAFK